MTGAGLLATCFLIMFVGSGARFVIGLTLLPMAYEFSIGRGLLGITVGIYFVITAACMFWAGRMIDRFEPRAVLAWGLLISAIGMGLISVISQPWQLVALYGVVFAIGNGLASITPVSVLVTRRFPVQAGIVNGLITAGMSAGQLFIIATITFVMLAVGWRWVYAGVGLAHLALLPLLYLNPIQAEPPLSAKVSEAVAPAAPHGDGLSLAEAARTRYFWLLITIYALCGLDDFFVSTHLVAFAHDNDVGPLVAGNLLALIGLAALIGALASGAWADQWGLIWPVLACFVLRIVSFGLIMVDTSSLSISIFTILFGFTFLMTAPLTVLFVRDVFGTAAIGTISGLVIMVHHMFGGLGAWFGGLIFDYSGNYEPAFLIMLASSLAALVLTLALKRSSPARHGTRSFPP